MTGLPPFAEWGVAVVVLAWLIREGLTFFKQKDQSEGEQAKTLITDLRQRCDRYESSLMSGMRAVHSLQRQQEGYLQTVLRQLKEIDIRHEKDMSNNLKMSALALAEVREQLAIVKEGVRAMHERLDEIQPRRVKGGE